MSLDPIYLDVCWDRGFAPVPHPDDDTEDVAA